VGTLAVDRVPDAAGAVDAGDELHHHHRVGDEPGRDQREFVEGVKQGLLAAYLGGIVGHRGLVPI
jgi:hypothetical protein